MPETSPFGAFLRARRSRLDPAQLGFAVGRRRAPGLRREEVAQRAAISTVWYTWLEQGRGGAPSAEVLERLARALLLSDVEREHLFLLGSGRPPEASYRPPAGVAPRLQRVVDALVGCPALIRTATWDVVAWNAAAAVVLTDYGQLPPDERNVLRIIFLRPESRTANANWRSVARFIVAVFRADAARAGAAAAVAPFVARLSRESPEFAAMWREADVVGADDCVKRLHHAALGDIALEHSTFAVDWRPELALLVYTPVDDADRARIAALAAAVTVSPPATA